MEERGQAITVDTVMQVVRAVKKGLKWDSNWSHHKYMYRGSKLTMISTPPTIFNLPSKIVGSTPTSPSTSHLHPRPFIYPQRQPPAPNNTPSGDCKQNCYKRSRLTALNSYKNRIRRKIANIGATDFGCEVRVGSNGDCDFVKCCFRRV